MHTARINSGGAGKDCGNWHQECAEFQNKFQSIKRNRSVVPLPANRDENHLVCSQFSWAITASFNCFVVECLDTGSKNRERGKHRFGGYLALDSYQVS